MNKLHSRVQLKKKKRNHELSTSLESVDAKIKLNDRMNGCVWVCVNNIKEKERETTKEEKRKYKEKKKKKKKKRK